VAECRWQGDGPVFTIDLEGRTWTLRLDEAHPCLSWSDGRTTARLLGLDHVAVVGRRDASAFGGSSVVAYERHGPRIQATFVPSAWRGLSVRAAWAPTTDQDGFDLEVQVWATSTAVFRRVEVAIASLWSAVASVDPACVVRWVEPRDVHAAASSYDGREPPDILHSLLTLPVPADSPHSLPPPIYPWLKAPAGGRYYAEMVQPNDCARRIIGEVAGEAAGPEGAVSIRYGLFGHDLEKGVVMRGRIRGVWIAEPSPEKEAWRRYESFVHEPPALGP
jgi:hypothetical protein